MSIAASAAAGAGGNDAPHFQRLGKGDGSPAPGRIHLDESIVPP